MKANKIQTQDLQFKVKYYYSKSPLIPEVVAISSYAFAGDKDQIKEEIDLGNNHQLIKKQAKKIKLFWKSLNRGQPSDFNFIHSS